MPGAKDRKIERIPEEYYRIGDAAFLLKADFAIDTVIHCDKELSYGKNQFKPKSNFLSIWNIQTPLAEIQQILESERKWSYQVALQGRIILIEINRIERMKRTPLLAYIKSSTIPAPLNIRQHTGTFAPSAALPAFYWEADQIQKDSECRFSPGIYMLTGYTGQEVNEFPKKYLSIVYQEDIAHLVKISTEQTFSSGNLNSEIIYRIVTKSGGLRWVKENIVCQKNPAKHNDSYFGLVCDITRIKEYEAKLLESESKLIDSNHAKDRFINILSHDLRAPFTSILGFSEILLNEPNLALKERNEYLTYIFDASQNQLQFINYLLDWSRLRTGSLKIEPQRLRVQTLIYNCVSILTGNAIRKNITITVDVAESLYVQADERLLTQVVLNLLSNSIKFSFDNSSITISAGIFNDRQIELVVKDRGVGIPLEDQAKMFTIEKVFSKDGTKGEKGSGFGLALVKEIITKHGGEIWFYSEPDSGTEFHLTLPLPSNVIMLILPDHNELRDVSEIIRAHFSEFSLIRAENGFEAIGIMASQLPNAVICNHDLPLMNGLQLIEALKHGEHELKVPFIILTKQLDDEIEMQYYRLGAEKIVNLPYDQDDLPQHLKSVLL